MTETLRQWHFRRLLDGPTIQAACSSEADALQYEQQRRNALAALLHNVKGAVGQHMDHLVESGTDVLGRIPAARLPENPEIRTELLQAYRVLRLDHQIEFAKWKLSVDDQTFLGMSSIALVQVTELLAGTTLLVALGISVAHLFFPIEWAPFTAVSLAIIGVAVRTWRDGLALVDERERYQEMHHRLELLIARWDLAGENDERRFQVAEEVEQLALEELRGFIRSHDRAQFLF